VNLIDYKKQIKTWKKKIDHAINIPQQSTARHNVKATTTTEIPKVEENSEEPKSKEFKDEQEQIDNLTKQLEQVQDENKKLQMSIMEKDGYISRDNKTFLKNIINTLNEGKKLSADEEKKMLGILENETSGNISNYTKYYIGIFILIVQEVFLYLIKDENLQYETVFRYLIFVWMFNIINYLILISIF